MRKHSVRKWIHAILDLLPLLVIPIFAINIINRSPEPLTVDYDTTETETVVTYKYQSNDVNSLNDLVEGNIYYFDFYNSTLDSYISIGEGGHLMFEILQIDDYDFENYNISLDDSILSGTAHSNISFVINISDSFYSTFAIYFQDVYEDNDYFLQLDIGSLDNNDFTLNGVCRLISILDITYLEDNTFSYTDYNEIISVETVTTGTVVTYDDTDIGSQFVYSLYHVTDKYFNMDDTFNMGSVYQWFSDNVFGGNPPLAVPIVWHVIVYEFIMDLLFLLYAVFMFLIDFCESFMERLFDKARNGGK